MTDDPFIVLPRDQYAHSVNGKNAGKEWWWHIGTLQCDGRTFGFEINVAGYADTDISFSQIMVTDLLDQVHFSKTTGATFDAGYAETNPDKPWFVKFGGPTGSDGAVSMTAPSGDPLSMNVEASFLDPAAGTPVKFQLQMAQPPERQPLLVWGNGQAMVYPGAPTPLQTFNYYYSLTHLATQGTLTIGAAEFNVTGTTWMDHQYGAFPGGTTWLLQDMQLNNGVHLSNFLANVPPAANQRMQSHVTVLTPDGVSHYLPSYMTLSDPWVSPHAGNVTYYMTILVEIPAFDARLTVTTPFQDQEFQSNIAPVYEGVATAAGCFAGAQVVGTAWNEQRVFIAASRHA